MVERKEYKQVMFLTHFELIVSILANKSIIYRHSIHAKKLPVHNCAVFSVNGPSERFNRLN